MRHGRSSRYGRYAGGPDPLAPPVDLSEALDAVAEDVMAGYSPERALREYLRRGSRTMPGLDDLAGRVAQRRKDLLGRHRLDGTLEEVRRLLDEAVLEERKQLARDIRMEDTDRSFREMQLQNLPASTAAAVTELSSYDWQSTTARERYEQIKDLLGREMLEARFAGMKDALQNATDEDRAAITEMLRDLNELLAKHARGEDTQQDFEDFMARHGDQFPEDPQDIEELIDALAKRSAAAQRMLRSMTPEQREELMALSAQAFGSPELMDQLGQLDANLQGLRPGEDWSGSESFEGDQGLGLGDGTGVLQDLAELDELAEQLSQSYAGSSLSDLDVDRLDRHLGDDAAASARTLAALEKALRDSGLLRRGTDGDLRLSPRAMRRLGQSLLKDAAGRLSGRQGQRDTRHAGAAGELTGSSRPWQFGDAEPWDVTRTVTNAIGRTAAEGRDPASGLRLEVQDVAVQETEDRTQAAVVLLVDTSFSMAAEGRWVPMKRTALALHHLVSTRFRGDALQLVNFGRYAQSLQVDELTALPPLREQGTNLHHGLLLAGRFFRQHPTRQPVLLVVTDGEPTAHLMAHGESWFSYPPGPETLRATMAELDRVGRMGAEITFFRLGDDPGLERFLAAMARRVGARVVAPDPEDLGAAVVGEFLRSRRPRFPSAFGDLDWD
ncbi:MAG: VWA domain-containing protein [Micrococcus sp.]|nr:VWA domain-containing protein [Micrococcus sp.]